MDHRNHARHAGLVAHRDNAPLASLETPSSFDGGSEIFPFCVADLSSTSLHHVCVCRRRRGPPPSSLLTAPRHAAQPSEMDPPRTPGPASPFDIQTILVTPREPRIPPERHSTRDLGIHRSQDDSSVLLPQGCVVRLNTCLVALLNTVALLANKSPLWTPCAILPA